VPPDRDHVATLSVPDDDAVADAVAVEVGEIDDGRSGAAVERAEGSLRVRVTAADLVALRASLNTWNRLVDVGERTAELGRRAVGAGGR